MIFFSADIFQHYLHFSGKTSECQTTKFAASRQRVKFQCSINERMLKYVMLLSHLWAYECNSAPICNDHKKFVGVCKHSWDFRKHAWGLANIRNMFCKHS